MKTGMLPYKVSASPYLEKEYLYLTHIVIEELNDISDRYHFLNPYYVPVTVQNPYV